MTGCATNMLNVSEGVTSALEEATAEFQSLKAVADTLGEVVAGVSAVIYGVSAVQAFQRNDTFSGIVDVAQTAASVAALAGQPEMHGVGRRVGILGVDRDRDGTLDSGPRPAPGLRRARPGRARRVRRRPFDGARGSRTIAGWPTRRYSLRMIWPNNESKLSRAADATGEPHKKTG